MHIGLTGGEGRLGLAIRQASEAAGIRVTYTSRLPTNQNGAKLDLRNMPDSKTLDSIFPNCDALVHCAAKVGRSSPGVDSDMFLINVGATVALASYALSRGISFLFISGASVYSNPHLRQIGEASSTGFNEFSGEYGYTKLLAEDAIQPLIRAGLQSAILRPSSIYGGIDAGNGLVSRMLIQAQTTGLVSVRPPLQDSIGLVHRQDVANAVLHVINKSIRGTYNVSAKRATSINSLADLVCSISRATKVISETANRGQAPTLTYDLNISRLEDTGWGPKIKLDQGLTEMARMLSIAGNG